MYMEEIHFIINPHAGTQQKRSIVQLIEQQANSMPYSPHIIFTREAGEATALARLSVERGVQRVVAVGGDGTINEVAQALVGTNTALGIIPAGSGNGLARHLHIPQDTRKALHIALHASPQLIDTAVVNDIPYFCSCGVGFDALISWKFAQRDKRGFNTYVDEVLKNIQTYKPESYTLKIDGKTIERNAFIIAINNASQYGNNAFIAPQASCSDGLLDVTIVLPFQIQDLPALALQLFNKTLAQNHRVEIYRARSIQISRQKESPIHIDGEARIMPDIINCEILPDSLLVLRKSK